VQNPDAIVAVYRDIRDLAEDPVARQRFRPERLDQEARRFIGACRLLCDGRRGSTRASQRNDKQPCPDTVHFALPHMSRSHQPSRRRASDRDGIRPATRAIAGREPVASNDVHKFFRRDQSVFARIAPCEKGE
jgi:hypothetical protein